MRAFSFLILIFVHPLQAKASEMENGFGSPESEDEIEKLEEQALSLRMVKLSAIFISFIFYQNFTTLLQFLVSISVNCNLYSIEFDSYFLVVSVLFSTV